MSCSRPGSGASAAGSPQQRLAPAGGHGELETRKEDADDHDTNTCSHQSPGPQGDRALLSLRARFRCNDRSNPHDPPRVDPCSPPPFCRAALVGDAAPGRLRRAVVERRVGRLDPHLQAAISINFIGDTMFVSTVHGVYSYDVSNPAAPKLLGALPMYIWENEDVDVDPVRKRLFVSRDPRGFTSPAVPGDVFPYGAVHIIDVSDPAPMKQLNFFLVAGRPHDDVREPLRHDLDRRARTRTPRPSRTSTGRPIFATDVTRPGQPQAVPGPDRHRPQRRRDRLRARRPGRRRGRRVGHRPGGVRGYWTERRPPQPADRQVETATGCKPIPYGGAGTPETATPSRFMHNSWRDWTPPAGGSRSASAGHARSASTAQAPAARKQPRRRRPTRNDVLLGTEENIVSDCKTSGRFVDLRPARHLRRRGLPRHREDAAPHEGARHVDARGPGGRTGCDSSHYFTSRGDGITANAFYTQGVRFLDTSDPTDIRQVGYFVNADSNTWAAYWHKGYVFVADFRRGVDVLNFDGARRRRRRQGAGGRGSARDRSCVQPHVFGGLCPLNVAAASAGRRRAALDAAGWPNISPSRAASARSPSRSSRPVSSALPGSRSRAGHAQEVGEADAHRQRRVAGRGPGRRRARSSRTSTVHGSRSPSAGRSS